MSPRAAFADQDDVSTGAPAPEAGHDHADLPPAVVIKDVQAIRALAHEARLTALDELFGTHRVYTATELAEQCDVTPSAMSYHLRALEKYGYIRRVERHGDGRNRYWQAAARRLRISGFDSSAHAKNAYANAQIKSLQRRISDEILRREQRGPSSEELHPILSSGILSLDGDRAQEFKQRLYALVAEYEQACNEHPEEDPDMRLHYFVSAIEEPVRSAAATPAQAGSAEDSGEDTGEDTGADSGGRSGEAPEFGASPVAPADASSP
ncbi:winged helix-turn-helix domain-containing protein [Nesterenkonia sp. HG001]|uniref:winged helix-turn-helix domain-containing protein n=1 Tax=Nesterenkonia sp. HG001 TaxID=2983207 RepID=UPI002AC4DE33|nr:winged helix-turn-helix domain-containing protein [Nesterenkonia sp. HG001]MDZ5077042.1 helix-turn-helix domain-containing protein [Nesterenkonia sp. HG001]